MITQGHYFGNAPKVRGCEAVRVPTQENNCLRREMATVRRNAPSPMLRSLNFNPARLAGIGCDDCIFDDGKFAVRLVSDLGAR